MVFGANVKERKGSLMLGSMPGAMTTCTGNRTMQKILPVLNLRIQSLVVLDPTAVCALLDSLHAQAVIGNLWNALRKLNVEISLASLTFSHTVGNPMQTKSDFSKIV
jgi:hypothetical protein